jgi:hypothetical protein
MLKIAPAGPQRNKQQKQLVFLEANVCVNSKKQLLISETASALCSLPGHRSAVSPGVSTGALQSGAAACRLPAAAWPAPP